MPKRTNILDIMVAHAPCLPALPVLGDWLQDLVAWGTPANRGLLLCSDDKLTVDVGGLRSLVANISRGSLVPCSEFFEKHALETLPVVAFRVLIEKRFFGSHVHLVVVAAIITQEGASAFQAALDQESALRWPVPDGRCYLCGNCVWTLTKAESHYDEEQARLAVLDAVDRDRRKFERLKTKFSGVPGGGSPPKRAPIPDEVRILVWRRDGGKCVKCGSQEDLEYDHIIPVSKGGSSTARNLQLLCERCNREKRDHI